MAGLFSTFNVAIRGMSVTQKALDVTSHNVANVNTEGFSRQRVNVETTRPYTNLGMTIGTGAEATQITRVRDSFMDYQIRSENSTQGTYTVRDSFLGQVESIFNEPSDTGISSLMGKFFDAFQQLSKQPGDSNARTVAAEQSMSLTDALNQTYTQLTNLKENVQSSIQSSIIDADSMLTQINALNKQIVNASITGDSPNDLLDKRDLLLDNLSSKFNIIVEKEDFNGISVKSADGSTNFISSKNPDKMNTLSFIDSAVQVSGSDTINDTSDDVYKITYYSFGDKTKPGKEIYVNGIGSQKEADSLKTLITDSNGYSVNKEGSSTDLKNSSSASPISINDTAFFNPDKGELNGSSSVESDVDSYINELNRLAKTLAFAVNGIHSGAADAVDSNGDPADSMPFFVNSSAAEYGSDNKLLNLKDTLNAESSINAGNITISKEIMNDVMNIKTRTHDTGLINEKDNVTDGELDGSRALIIAQLRDTQLKIQNIGGSINSRADLFSADKGNAGLTDANHMNINSNTDGIKMDSYFKDTVDKLGIQEQQAQRMVKNEDTLLSSLKNSKNSVSGVSLNEETANLIQYQHAYQANAKVISVITDLLDSVIGIIK